MRAAQRNAPVIGDVSNFIDLRLNRRCSIQRYFLANSGVFLAYLVFGMINTYAYVAQGQPLDSFYFGTLVHLLNWTSLPTAIAVNYKIMCNPDRTKRLTHAVVVAIVLFGLSLVPYALVIIEFQLSLGGTL